MPTAGRKPATERTRSGQLEDTQTRPVDATFVHAVRDALTYLYDWVKLRRSHLVGVFDLGHRDDPSLVHDDTIDADRNSNYSSY